MYVFNEDGVNVTLQAAADIIVESMNTLSTAGAAVRDVEGEEVRKLLIQKCFFSSNIILACCFHLPVDKPFKDLPTLKPRQ